jgi:hypothetical protein
MVFRGIIFSREKIIRINLIELIDGSVSNVTVKLWKQIRILGYGLGTMANYGQRIDGKRIVIFCYPIPLHSYPEKIWEPIH